MKQAKSLNFKTITTEKLTLQTFTEDDITATYVAWLNDPEVVRYSEQRHQIHSINTCKEFYQSTLKSSNIFLTIKTKYNLHHIGNMMVTIDPFNNVADVSIMIGDKSYWNVGYGKEAWCALVSALLNQHKIRKIEAGTMAVNKPMIGLMQASGMREEGVRKSRFLLDGKLEDAVLYGLT